MDADWNFLDVVAVFIAKIKIARLRKIDLVRRDGKLASNHAPRLHVDFRTVKRRFVRYIDIVDSGILKDVPRHFLGLFPKLGFIYKFLAKLPWIVRRETHQIFLDSEELEVVQIHLVDGVEFRRTVPASYRDVHRSFAASAHASARTTRRSARIDNKFHIPPAAMEDRGNFEAQLRIICGDAGSSSL